MEPTKGSSLFNIKIPDDRDLVNLREDNPGLYQTVEKKDLIAYHNISQENLDKAIQLGGLAVPSIAITKKEMDFSNFGNYYPAYATGCGESEGNTGIYP